ncbi:hypothetical protein Tco_1480588 [Tanacetum coccineum]
MDDLYNNLKVYESKIKGKSSSSSNSHNVAFVSSNNSNSTNEIVNTAHSVSVASSKDQASTASYVMFCFFSNKSNYPQLDYEDLEHIDADDLEETDLKWKVVMLTMRVKRFIKKTGRKMDLNDKETIVFHRTKIECYNCHRRDLSLENAGHQGIKGIEIEMLQEECTSGYIYHKCLGCSRWDSAKDKTGLGYDGQMNESELNNIHMNESKVVHSVFNSRESDMDDNLINDRFRTDEYVFKSAMRKTTTSVPETETSISKTSKDIIENPKTVRPSAPIIGEWDTDNDMRM